MAGFGLIIAGALGGWSDARLDEIKAQRDERMKELDQQRADARAQMSEDRADARSDKALAARKAEFDAEQSTAGTYSTTDTGETVRVHGDTATPVKGADGKPIKLATKSSDKPADQQMVEYLMSLGKTQDQALDWVKTSRTKSDDDSKLSLYKAILTANGGDSEAAQAEADKVWAKYGGGSSDAAADPYANDRTAPQRGQKVTVEPMKKGGLRAPPGDGDKEYPFQGSTQADIDWFKKYAKPGQIIQYGGALYTHE